MVGREGSPISLRLKGRRPISERGLANGHGGPLKIIQTLLQALVKWAMRPLILLFRWTFPKGVVPHTYFMALLAESVPWAKRLRSWCYRPWAGTPTQGRWWPCIIIFTKAHAELPWFSGHKTLPPRCSVFQELVSWSCVLRKAAVILPAKPNYFKKNHFLKKSLGQCKYNIQLWTLKLPREPAEIKWLKQVPTGNRASWNRLVNAQLVKCRKRYAKNDDSSCRNTGSLSFLTAVKS